MNNLSRNQDFEMYAQEKPFNFSTNPVWEKIVDKSLPAQKNTAQVFDYGCGDGKIFPALVKKGIHPENIFGVEVSRQRIERCQEIGFKNAIYLPLHSKLPYRDRQFDLINYLEVIEHVPEDEIDFYLEEMARVLKSDGQLIVTTPNYPVKRVIDLYDAFVHKRWTRLKDDPTHVTFYNHNSFRKTLERNFKKVDIQCYKEGLLYKRIKSPYFMHKMVAICQDPK